MHNILLAVSLAIMVFVFSFGLYAEIYGDTRDKNWSCTEYVQHVDTADVCVKWEKTDKE